jgi:uncharacterized membrane protein (Fun14 family)
MRKPTVLSRTVSICCLIPVKKAVILVVSIGAATLVVTKIVVSVVGIDNLSIRQLASSAVDEDNSSSSMRELN